MVEAAAGVNSTWTVLPGARHQIRNQGSEDVQVLVVLDSPPFKVLFGAGLPAGAMCRAAGQAAAVELAGAAAAQRTAVPSVPSRRTLSSSHAWPFTPLTLLLFRSPSSSSRGMMPRPARRCSPCSGTSSAQTPCPQRWSGWWHGRSGRPARSCERAPAAEVTERTRLHFADQLTAAPEMDPHTATCLGGLQCACCKGCSLLAARRR